MTKNVVWITGAGGFSGRHLCETIRRETPDVQIVAVGRHLAESQFADERIEIDLADVRAVAEAARQTPPKWLVHLAGCMPPADPQALHIGNGLLLHQLLIGLRAAELQSLRLLNVSSAAEYQSDASGLFDESAATGGASPYGQAKTAQSYTAHHLGALFGFEVITARPFNLLGPGLSENLVMGRVCQQLSSGTDTLSLGRLDSIRDFLDIRDAARAYWLLVKEGSPGEAYNVCTGVETVISDLVDLAIELSERDIQLETRNDFVKIGDVDRACGLNKKLLSIGWRPELSLRQSLSDMLEPVS